jgi:hypothetical protein
MKDGKSIDVPMSQYEGRLTGKRSTRKKIFNDQSYERVRETHLSVLHQLEIAAVYIEQHLQQLHEENEGPPDNWIMKEHKCCFTMWLKDQNLPIGEENMMGALVQGLS